ncbi:MAG TPA: hypothetical protein VL356_04965 [Acidocella sp.]|jgi:hypothetical protein|nr:hypothetical protein [Acidocella sp.]
MTDRPIIFSAPMVRALLAGMKTQTRRLLKPQPFIDNTGNFCVPDKKGKAWNWGQHIDGKPCTRNYVKTVRFKVGDRLWVRETWSVASVFTDVVEVRYRAHERAAHSNFVEQIPRARARKPMATWPVWKPSIHMPRWASRLTLTVTDVRVQRLQDITSKDIAAEGIDHLSFGGASGAFDQWLMHQFGGLWDKLHGPGAWDANPWVAAITFELRKGNIDGWLRTARSNGQTY